MKNIKKVFIIVAFVATMFGLVGCFGPGQTESFAITGYPQTTYVKGENFNWDGLIVKVNDATYNKEAAAEIGVVFPGELNTKNPGVFTVTVKYKTLFATFQYIVLDSYFANGTGTKENPYQVSTPEQLGQVLTTHDKLAYYVLINDIDMANVEYKAQSASNFVLDGQGYSIKNLAHPLAYNIYGNGTTFKNLNVYINSSTGEYFNRKGDEELDINGVFAAYQHGDSKNAQIITYENVNTFGLISLNAQSKFSIYGFASADTTLVIKNCSNYADIFNPAGTGSSILVAGNRTNDGNDAAIYIIGFKNYGSCVSMASSFVLPTFNYSTGVFKASYVIDSTTVNYGTLTSLTGEVVDVNNKFVFCARRIGEKESNNSNFNNFKVYKYESVNEILIPEKLVEKADIESYADLCQKISKTALEKVKQSIFFVDEKGEVVEFKYGAELYVKVDDEIKDRVAKLELTIVCPTYFYDKETKASKTSVQTYRYMTAELAAPTEAVSKLGDYRLLNIANKQETGIDIEKGTMCTTDAAEYSVVNVNGHDYYLNDVNGASYLEFCVGACQYRLTAFDANGKEVTQAVISVPQVE